MTDYRTGFDVLRNGKIRFIVIGGVAATAHGSSQLTNDLDVVYARGAEDIANLASALAPHHPYLRGVPPGRPKDIIAVAELEALLTASKA